MQDLTPLLARPDPAACVRSYGSSAVGKALHNGADLENFANTGNKTIFDDVFPKLRASYNGPPLKGKDAAAMDAKMLSQEQHLVQPLYDAARSGGYLSTIQSVADKTAFGSRVGAFLYGVDLPAFEGDIGNVANRWRYGMKNMGYSGTAIQFSSMPRP